MQYFKVKKESDQTRKPHNKKCDILVGGELFTKSEIKKMNINEFFFNEHFTEVEISKKKTYFMFGARFESSLTK